MLIILQAPPFVARACANSQTSNDRLLATLIKFMARASAPFCLFNKYASPFEVCAHSNAILTVLDPRY